MNEPATDEGVELWLDRGPRPYHPGERLTGYYRLAGWRDGGLTAIELSVLWYTAGQGEEDFFVHHFERSREPAVPAGVDATPHEFTCVLPASPLSYDGQIVRVCWAARLRGFFTRNRQRVVEAPFWLATEGGDDA